MDDLLQFIPEEKQADFKTAYEKSGYIKSADENVLLDTVKKNQRVFDLIVKDPMENRIKNFKEKDLPGLLEAAAKEREDKIRAELQPKETEDQKRIRALEQKSKDDEAKLAAMNRKSELRETYKGIDPALAETLYQLDDESIKKIMESKKADKDRIAELEKTVKYGGTPPKSGGGGDVISEAEFLKLDSKARAEYLAKGGTIE